MTALSELLTTLHPLEAKVLRALDGTPDPAGEARIAELAGIQEAQARMASEWLHPKAAQDAASADSTPFVAHSATGQCLAKDAITDHQTRRKP